MPDTRRGAGKGAGGGRGTAGGPAPAPEAGPSQARQETGSSAATLDTADFPEKTTDKEFIVLRSNYNSAKMMATASLEETRKKAVSMQEKVEAGTAPSILRRAAMRLQEGMDKAEAAIDQQILLGTKLISFSSYLAVALVESDANQATQANGIQVAIGEEIKPLIGEVDRI